MQTLQELLAMSELLGAPTSYATQAKTMIQNDINKKQHLINQLPPQKSTTSITCQPPSNESCVSYAWHLID
jgi:hypothetical protein